MIVNLGRWDSLSGDGRLGSFHLTLTEQIFVEGEAPDFIMGLAYNMDAQGGRPKLDEPGIGLFVEGSYSENKVIVRELQIRAEGLDGIQHRPIAIGAILPDTVNPDATEIRMGLEFSECQFIDPVSMGTFGALNKQGLTLEPFSDGPGLVLYQNSSGAHITARTTTPQNDFLYLTGFGCVALPGIIAFSNGTAFSQRSTFTHEVMIERPTLGLGGCGLHVENDCLYFIKSDGTRYQVQLV